MSDPRVSAADAVFAELYRRYYRPVRHFCRRRLADDLVDDAVAETFLTAWRRLDEVPAGDRALVWIYGVAYRVVANQWRSALRRRRLEVRLLSIGRQATVAADESVVDEEESAASWPPRAASVTPTPKCSASPRGNSWASPTSPPYSTSTPTQSSNASTGPGATSAASTAGSNTVHFRPPLLPKEVPSDHRRRSGASVRTGRPRQDRRRRPRHRCRRLPRRPAHEEQHRDLHRHRTNTDRTSNQPPPLAGRRRGGGGHRGRHRRRARPRQPRRRRDRGRIRRDRPGTGRDRTGPGSAPPAWATTPAVEDTGTRVGFIGLPPEGAPPSTPEGGEIAVSIRSCQVPTGELSDVDGLPPLGALWVLADGRLIWLKYEDFPGRELAVDGSARTAPHCPRESSSCGPKRPRRSARANLTVAAPGTTTVSMFPPPAVSKETPSALTMSTSPRIMDPWSWLPATAWEDREIRAYVPFRYLVMFGRLRSAGPKTEAFHGTSSPRSYRQRRWRSSTPRTGRKMGTSSTQRSRPTRLAPLPQPSTMQGSSRTDC